MSDRHASSLLAFFVAALAACLAGGAGPAAAQVQVEQAIVEGGYSSGTAVMDQDPQFADPAGGDYRLTSGSPALDGGDKSLLPADALDLNGNSNTTEALPIDISGQARVNDNDGDPGTAAEVDLGAFEAPSSTNRNTAPTFAEGSSASLTIGEDAGEVSISGLLAADDPDSGQTLTWTVETAPSNGTLSGLSATASSGGTGITPSGVSYAPNGNYSGSGSFDIKVSDGSSSDVITVNVTVQDAPEVASITRSDPSPTSATSVGFEVTFSEPVGGVGDEDLSLSGGASGTVGSFGPTSASNSITVTVSSVSGTGDLRLDLNDDGSITNGNGVPLGGEGTSGAGDGSFTSGETYAIDNSAPAFSAGGSNSALVDEQSTGAVLDAEAGDDGTADPDASVTYALGSPVGDDADFSIDGTSGQLSLGSAQDFEAPSDSDGNGDYELTVTATDDVGNATTQDVTVSIRDVDETPTFAGVGDQTAFESASAGTEVVDIDADVGGSADEGVSYALTAGNTDVSGNGDRAFAIGSGGGLTIADPADIDKTQKSSFTVTVEASEGTEAATQDVTINVTDDVAPTLSSSTPSDGSGGHAPSDDITLTFSEEVQAGSGDITIVDKGDGSSTQALSVTGSAVSISGTAVTLSPSSVLETSTNYSVSVDAGAITDGNGNDFTGSGFSDPGVLNFGTADTDPAFTEASPTSITVKEDQSADLTETLRVADLSSSDDLTWSVSSAPSHGTLSGIDGQTESISGADSPHELSTSPTYAPGADYAGSDAFEITVEDNNPGQTATLTVNVTVEQVNDAPTLSVSTSSGTFTEGSGPVGVFSGATIDLQESGQQVQSLRLTVDNLADGSAELLRVDGSDVALTDGTSVTTAGNGLSATVSVSGAAATVDLTGPSGASFDKSVAESIIGGLGYKNASDDPTAGSGRTITLTALQDDGGTGNGGNDTASLSASGTVSIEPVNDAPQVAGDLSISVDEGAETTLTSTDLEASDPDDSGSGLTYTVTAAPDHGTIEVGGAAASSFTEADLNSGSVAYVHDGSNTTADAFTTELADGGEDGAGTASATIDVSINPQNEAPSAPTGLAATASAGAVQLSWSSNSESDMSGGTYEVHRSTTSGFTPGGGTLVATTAHSGGGESYTDDGSGNLPAPSSSATYYYRVIAVDQGGLKSSPSSETSAQLPPETVTAQVSRSFGGADGPEDYRLVALPGQVDRPIAKAVSGKAGQTWQAYRDDGSSSGFLVKYDGSSAFAFKPGNGFWLTSRQGWQSDNQAPALDLSGGTATIDLRGGWNVISNPLDKGVSWSAVEDENVDTQSGERLEPIWAFDGTFTNVVQNGSGTFASAKTGKAYYFFNDKGLSSLTIPYPGATKSSKGATPEALAQKTENASRSSVTSRSSESGAALALTARPAETNAADAGGTPGSTVRVGLHPEAKRSVGPKDRVAPPARFAKTALRIKAHSKSSGSESSHSKRARSLMTERRPASEMGEGYTYSLRLTRQGKGAATITASGLEAFSGRSVALLHPKGGSTYDLKKTGHVQIPASAFGPEGTASLQVAIGTEGYVQEKVQRALPEEVTFVSYPNPISGQGTLEYTLPEAADVTLRIYDALGRQVATLVAGKQEAGRHRASLEASRLSSGVYFGRLTVSGETRTQKITVVR